MPALCSECHSDDMIMMPLGNIILNNSLICTQGQTHLLIILNKSLICIQGQTHLLGVEYIHHLVIDEADRMIEKGHFEELTSLFEMINA